MVKIFCRIFLFLIVTGPGWAEEAFTHVSLLDRAQADNRWTGSGVVQQLEIIRDLANAEPVSSDPLSDRYSITYYAGPIDWVHFLNLAIFVYSGDQTFGEAQLNQWITEGGPDFEAGRNRSNPSAATPDDLPSNTLGALFGRKLAALGSKPRSPPAAADLHRTVEAGS